ncbi:MAG TPA: divergent polysaccharide deacetylase family protein [Azospirillaceae bacterium]|nr:divergent polysaccharide deacetylase family protein [Azospirillaceae bacterium]
MARLSLKRKTGTDDLDGPAPDKGAGSAGILATRFGLGRAKAYPAADPFDDPPRERKPRRAAKDLAFPLALGLSALALAGVGAWLALTAEATLRERSAQVPKLRVPVLMADGTPRFEDKAVELEPEKELDPVDIPVTLGPSRVDALVEKSRLGVLPRIGPDGQAPWQAYARPFPHEDKRPRIAIVVTDLGLSAPVLDAAMGRLPGAVTFAFQPGSPELQRQIDQSRQNGHEVLLTVPMEPLGYPRNDPGPGTLLTALPDERNVERLEQVMAQATGYVGLTSTTGAKFLTSRPNLQAVLAQVQRRGLSYVDSWIVPNSLATKLSTTLGIPRAVSDVQVDRVASPNGVDAQLAELERLAKANGAAVGFAQPYPVTIERIALWAASLRDRGIVLAPITAVLNRQADR